MNNILDALNRFFQDGYESIAGETRNGFSRTVTGLNNQSPKNPSFRSFGKHIDGDVQIMSSAGRSQ